MKKPNTSLWEIKNHVFIYNCRKKKRKHQSVTCYRKKKERKYQTNEKQSVQSDAKEFLENAARALNGNNEIGLKGPLIATADGSGDVEKDTAWFTNLNIGASDRSLLLVAWSNRTMLFTFSDLASPCSTYVE